MRLIVVVCALLFAQFLGAQRLTLGSLNDQTSAIHKKIVTQALSYSDTQTAINSMYYIIALEGVGSTYKDSLAIAYFNQGNYLSSQLLSEELLASKPDNLQLLEINAASLQNLGATKEAIEAYEGLFTKTKNMAHGYKLAMLQYSLKRLMEAQITIAQTLQCEVVENAYLQFPIDKYQNQNVPLKAAAYNLQGLIAFELKDNAEAKQAFEAALKIMPEFTTATQNANTTIVAIQNNTN